MHLHTAPFSGSQSDRLDRALRTQFEAGVSREKIKEWICGGLCSVDGQLCTDPSQKIRVGQLLELTIPDTTTSLQPEDGDVTILWQDDHLLVIDKPSGLTVHPAPSCPQGTLIQRLLPRCPALQHIEGWRPGIVHRIDKDTSGLIVIAPDEAARLGLAQAFANREVHKTYLALVAGVMAPAEGDCLEPMGRHPTHKVKMAIVPNGRPAHTEWKTLYVAPDTSYSVLAVRIHTGRTHQIRVHMAHMGHPLLGDSTYAPHAVAALAPRQMLHAWRLAFTHPLTGKPLSFTCPPPSDFMDMLCRPHQAEHIVITGLPGSGKSLLTQLLAEQNVPVWSADDVVRQLYEPGGDGWLLINRQYRGQFTQRNLPVDKTALAEAVRTTPGMREELESIIHPLVTAHLHAFWSEADAQDEELAIAEVPLWLEMGASTPKYGPNLGPVILVGVDCPTPTRHLRLHTHRGWPEPLIAAADSWQWPASKKMAACTMVVDNSGDPAELKQHALALLSTLRTARQARTAQCKADWLKHFTIETV